MQTPTDKIKKADKELKWTAIACLFIGSLVIVAVLALFLKHDFSNIWDKELPTSQYKQYIKALVVAVGWILPCLSILLLMAAYKIWDYRRKRDAQN